MKSVWQGSLTAGLIFMLGAWPIAGLAADYPNRPLRLLVTFPPGGSGDFQGRIVAAKLTEQMGQHVVVDNRPGASGIVATEVVAKSQPDGYTLLLGPVSSLAINPALMAKLPYDPVKDFAPISMTGRTTLALAAGMSVPANSVKELIALAKAAPGRMSYGSTGIGNVTHLAGEIMKSLAGIDLIHVPYKGAGPQLIDVISGNVAVGFVSLTGALPHMRANRLKVFFVNSKQRMSAAPEIPTAAELGMADIEIAAGWFGVLAPARTAKAIVSRLNTEVVKAIESPEVRERFVNQGLVPVTTSPEAFAALIKSDIPKWAKVVKQAGIRIH